MDNGTFTINNVQVKEVTVFDRLGNTKKQTQVRMFVGEDGPFMESFGPGTDRADDAPTINAWKQSIVAKLMATKGQ